MTAQIVMIRTVDQLQAGDTYNLDEDFAMDLVEQGSAMFAMEQEIVGPDEVQIVQPSETKRRKKKPYGYS